MFQSKPGRVEAWFCKQCRRKTDDTPAFHDYFKHQIKTAAWCCIFCEHQDMIGQAFAAHLDALHNVAVDDMDCLKLFWRDDLPPYKVLGLCTMCDIRMSETIYALPEHRMACKGQGVRPEKRFRLTAETREEFEEAHKEELARLRSEFTSTPPGVRQPRETVTKPARKFYMPGGMEDEDDDDDDDGEDENLAVKTKTAVYDRDLAVKTTTVTGAYSNLCNEVVQYRAATTKQIIRRDGSMTAAERADTEFEHLAHNVLSVGEVTARLPNVAFTRKRYYSEALLIPGVYDVQSESGEVFRLIMENHPANRYWEHLTPPDLPRDFVEDTLDINQWCTTARPYAIVGVGSLKEDIPPGRYKIMLRKRNADWSWITFDDRALLAAE